MMEDPSTIVTLFYDFFGLLFLASFSIVKSDGINRLLGKCLFAFERCSSSPFKGLSLTSLQKRLAKQNKYCCCYPYFKKKPEKMCIWLNGNKGLYFTEE